MSTLEVSLRSEPALSAMAACDPAFGSREPSPRTLTDLLADVPLGMSEVDSALGKEVLRRLHPRSLADVCAAFALSGGGTLCNATLVELEKRYLRGRAGAVAMMDPLLMPFVSTTYGVFLYNEQVCLAVAALAGCSLSNADEVRRAIKRNCSETLDWARSYTVGAMRRRGLSTRRSERVWHTLGSLRELAPKSHYVGRAVLALRAATIRANAPAAYSRALQRANEAGANDTSDLGARPASEPD